MDVWIRNHVYHLFQNDSVKILKADWYKTLTDNATFYYFIILYNLTFIHMTIFVNKIYHKYKLDVMTTNWLHIYIYVAQKYITCMGFKRSIRTSFHPVFFARATFIPIWAKNENSSSKCSFFIYTQTHKEKLRPEPGNPPPSM